MAEKCKRIVYDGKGGTEQIEVDHHQFAYSGQIPCTGLYRCIYCGYIAEYNHFGDKQ